MIDTGAGVIDADYRGVVFILLFNLSDKDFEGMLGYVLRWQFIDLGSALSPRR
jgi:hypothetical protein